MQTRVHLLVSGRVQGVFFRQKTRQQARSLGVNGWVRNLDDGRVEAIFEGETSAVESLVEFCSKGPNGALVTDVSVDWEPFKDEFRSFDIVH